MKTLFFSCMALLMLVSFSLQAQEAQMEMKKESHEHTITGYLIDKMCGSGMAKKSADEAMAGAAKHTKKCATNEDCAASGYGVMMEGKWNAFDEAGSKKAVEFLKKTKSKDHLYVAVSGTMEGEKIMVTSIKAAKEKTN